MTILLLLCDSLGRAQKKLFSEDRTATIKQQNHLLYVTLIFGFFLLQVILVKCYLLNGSLDTSQTLLRLWVNGIRAPYITFCTAIMDYREAHTAAAHAVQLQFLSLTESFWRDSSLCSEMTHSWSQLEVGAVELIYPGSQRKPIRFLNVWPLQTAFVSCFIQKLEGDLLHPPELLRSYRTGRSSP